MFNRIFSILKKVILAVAGFFLVLTLLLLIFRNKIERYAISQLDPYFKVPVYIHDVDFTFWRSLPNFSLRLKGVLIRDYDDEMQVQSDTLLYAHQIDLKANTWGLMRGDLSIQAIEVQQARIGLRVDKNGKENFDIFVKDTSSTEKKSFEVNLKKVLFNDTEFSFQNFETQQEYRAHFDKMRMSGTFTEDVFEMLLSSNFRLTKFKDKSLTLLRSADINIETKVLVDTKNKRYEVPKTIADINNIPFEMSYHQDSVALNLELKAQKIPLEDLMSTVHQKDLDKFKNMTILGEADLILKVNGSPKINQAVNLNADFAIRKGVLKDKATQLNIPKLELQGKYRKEVGYAENIELSKFEVKTMGQSLSGKLSLSDFQSPRIKAFAHGDIDLKALHHFFPIPKVENISGQLSVDGNFQAAVYRPGQRDQEVKISNSKSDLDCKNISLKLSSDLPEFQEINGKISTRNDDFVFNQFVLRTKGTLVEFSGKMNNLVDHLEQGSPLNLNVAVRADQIDVNEFLVENASQQQKSSAQLLGVYTLPKNILGQIEYDIKSLTVGKHTFSKLLGVTILRDREMDFRKIQLEHIGSQIKGDFRMQEKTPGTIDLIGDVQSNGIDLKKLFAEWNNFEQEHIKSENIKGRAEVKLKFQLPYNLQKGPIKEALLAQVSLKITEGALVKVAALKEIAASMKANDFVRIFLGRTLKSVEQKLDHLSFENLENTFTISNSKFVIPKMTIRTNIMDLVVYGWQHFDESLEYHFEFDIKELRKNNRDAQRVEIKQDLISTRLFLKMFGTLSNPQFSWDSDAKKAYKQEQRTQEKQDVKGMLKSEFGLFKKDSTVQRYDKTKAPKETITLDFGDETPPQPNLEKKKKEINDKFNKIRKENKTKDEKVVFEFE